LLHSVNIGNARLYGLEEDLNLNSNQFQTAVSLLFVTYILSELPSNLIIKHYVSPSRWISFITTAWGVIATLTGICQNYGGLIVCRLFLGLVEGGLFPGCTIYLTLFYTKRELALRVGYLFVSAALAGAFGGLLAYGVGFMDGVAGLRGWRWIMIIEGLPTFVLGISCWWLLADDPDTAYYLNDEEKAMILDRRASQLGQSDVFEWKDVRKGLKDWKVYVFCVGQFCMDTMLYGYSTFLPTIIEAIRPGSSTAVTQLLTVPCYTLGAISYMAAARFSDWRQVRGPVVVVFGICSVVGYAILMSPTSSGAHYLGCFLVALGLYVSVGIPLAWLPSNNPRYGKRTTASGLQLTIGNTSGIMASFVSILLLVRERICSLYVLTIAKLYPKAEGPRYVRGHAVTMSLVAFGSLVYAVISLYFAGENAKRENGNRDHVTDGLSDEEVVALGDENPRFRFSK
jgi:sugar phosphate permease